MNEPKIGQVISATSSNGNKIDKAEMLLLPKAKITLEYKENKVRMNVEDTDFLSSNLNGYLDYNTLDDLIKILIRMRKQMPEEKNEH